MDGGIDWQALSVESSADIAVGFTRETGMGTTSMYTCSGCSFTAPLPFDSATAVRCPACDDVHFEQGATSDTTSPYGRLIARRTFRNHGPSGQALRVVKTSAFAPIHEDSFHALVESIEDSDMVPASLVLGALVATYSEPSPDGFTDEPDAWESVRSLLDDLGEESGFTKFCSPFWRARAIRTHGILFGSPLRATDTTLRMRDTLIASWVHVVKDTVLIDKHTAYEAAFALADDTEAVRDAVDTIEESRFTGASLNRVVDSKPDDYAILPYSRKTHGDVEAE